MLLQKYIPDRAGRTPMCCDFTVTANDPSSILPPVLKHDQTVVQSFCDFSFSVATHNSNNTTHFVRTDQKKTQKSKSLIDKNNHTINK
eukprot:m.124301 g.124301  ORF g.124301 m.124301 type:complete len:88 (-) comp29054_c0_seq2:113-376(-)